MDSCQQGQPDQSTWYPEDAKSQAVQSCLDLANGYWSLPLAAVSQPKMAFTHKGKSYVWAKLAQGYKNTLNIFQEAVMRVLTGLGVTVYIDDVYFADDD